MFCTTPKPATIAAVTVKKWLFQARKKSAERLEDQKGINRTGATNRGGVWRPSTSSLHSVSGPHFLEPQPLIPGSVSISSNPEPVPGSVFVEYSSEPP
jgi:hypothetical protein